MKLSPEAQIQTKIEAFKARKFSVLQLSEKQIEAMMYLTDQMTDELLYGGAAYGGKTFLSCEWLLWSCLSYPETRWFVGRHSLKQIRKSVLVTFRKVCKKHSIPASWYKINDNDVNISFQNGSFIDGIELHQKPTDVEFDAFGSTEYTGGLIEEAGQVVYKAFEIAGTRIGRQLNKEYGIRGKVLVTGNPARNFMYSLFIKPWKQGTLPKGRVFLQSLISHNTFADAAYNDRMQKLKGSARERLLLGNWEYEDDPLSLIESVAIADLFTNDYLWYEESKRLADSKKRKLICDVALHGSDLFRIGVFYGDVLVDHSSMAKSGGKQVLEAIKQMRAKHGIQASDILYDADGVGGFIGEKGGFIPGAKAFHGNASPLKRPNDPDTEYANLKAQCGYLLAEKVNDGQMWAKAVTKEEDQETLSEELAQVKMDKVDTDGKKRLRKKELIVQDLGRSPDFSDLFLMKQYFDIKEALTRPAHQRTLNTY